MKGVGIYGIITPDIPEIEVDISKVPGKRTKLKNK